MFDLCSGNQTASKAMKDRGWEVITVDIDPALKPDIVADVRAFSYHGPRPDLIWASPPCNEFTREFLIWTRKGICPDMSIFHACRKIIHDARPRFWIIENVRGATRYFGRYTEVHYPFYLWGFFPPLGKIKLKYKRKDSYTSSNKIGRAAIPYQISLAVAQAIERQLVLPLPPIPIPLLKEIPPC